MKKRIISLFLTLVLCAGLFAALGVSASAVNDEPMTAIFPYCSGQNQMGDVSIEGHCGTVLWYTSLQCEYYPFTVSVPDSCRLTKVTFNFYFNDRWPSVSGGTVSTPEIDTMVVSFAPEDCVHSVTLYGVETAYGKTVTAADNEWQAVKSLTVEYTCPHTHEKNANAYHAPVSPTCGAGSVEYWECTNPNCKAKLNAAGNSIADITVPGTGAHSVNSYSVDIPATCKTTGVESGVCSVCKETVTRGISIDPNAHCYSDEWSYNDDYHWHELTCGCSVEPDYAEHNWVYSEGTYECEDCGMSILGTIPIESVDLSSLNVGKGWVGKTVGEVESDIGYFATETMDCDEYMFCVKNDNNNYDTMMSDAYFESGKTYALALWMSAKEGYYFPGNEALVNASNYAGTKNPDETIIACVYEDVTALGDPIPATRGHTLVIAFEFTATETPIEITETAIESVDLSSLNIGKNWVGKTVSEVQSALGVIETDTMVCYDYGFVIKDGNDYIPMDDDGIFESGKTYGLSMWISAKGGYYFPGTDSDDEKNYDGTIIPADVVAAAVTERMFGDKNTQYGHFLLIEFEFTATAEEPDALGSTLSEGNVWIICAIGAAAVIAVGAIVIVRKKKQNAP